MIYIKPKMLRTSTVQLRTYNKGKSFLKATCDSLRCNASVERDENCTAYMHTGREIAV